MTTYMVKTFFVCRCTFPCFLYRSLCLQLEQQITALQKKLKDAEAKGRAGGGGGNDQQVKALEMKLKEAEADKRRELKQLEQELTKNSKVNDAP